MTGHGDPEQIVHELINRYHPRASIVDGGRMMLEPSQVLENIANAMERLDNDINTPISIEEDVASLSELSAMIESLMMGPTLAVHVVNTAMKIMTARYPADLVTRPLSPNYDLRQIVPLTINEPQHQIAKTIFNLRTTSTKDLTEKDIAAAWTPRDLAEQLEVFTILFYMYGTKVGALKHRTGIQ